MIIQGIQKMTLLDFPGHVACTLFLSGCDFRCPFCHNYELVEGTGAAFDGAELKTPPAMSHEEFFKFLQTRKGLLDGVAITDGEPCLRRDLPEFIAEIKDAGFLVKLDTNGNHPDMLRNLVRQRLIDYVAMDIKNSPEKYAKTVGLEALDLDSIMESIDILINGVGADSRIPYEFRTTVISQFHEEEDFLKIGEMIQGAEKYFLQPFVDRDMVPDHSLSAPPIVVLQKYRELVSRFVSEAQIRGIDG